jgi:orotate phosphoribosyltransferase
MDALVSGQFLVSQGIRTDYFVNISKLLTNKRALDIACDIIFDQFENEKIDTIVSAYSLGASILGYSLSERFNAKFIPIKELELSKKYGFYENERVLILADVLITGQFILKIINELRISGSNCIGVSVMFLRNHEVQRKLKESVKIKCIFNFSDLFSDIPPTKNLSNKLYRIHPHGLLPIANNGHKKKPELIEYNTNDSPDSSYTVINEGVILRTELNNIKSGHKDFRKYEDIVSRIFQYLFIPPLKPPLSQKPTLDSHERRDLLLPNTGEGFFYEHLRTRYQSEFIVIECKNFSGKIGKKEVGQLRLYARKKSIGRFGILVSRKTPSKSALKERFNAFQDDDALILFIDDKILYELIDIKIKGKDPADFLDKMRLEFLSSI